jgi:hypothetical protein
VDALWRARIAGEYDKAYDIFDFSYKAVTPKNHYLNNIGVITYLEYSQGATAINGNEATVDMKFKYEVKSTMVPQTGKPIVVEPTETEAPNKWVWVGSDWYLVYSPSFDPPMLKY